MALANHSNSPHSYRDVFFAGIFGLAAFPIIWWTLIVGASAQDETVSQSFQKVFEADIIALGLALLLGACILARQRTVSGYEILVGSAIVVLLTNPATLIGTILLQSVSQSKLFYIGEEAIGFFITYVCIFMLLVYRDRPPKKNAIEQF